MMIRARGRAAIETNVIKRRQTNDRDTSEERGARPLPAGSRDRRGKSAHPAPDLRSAVAAITGRRGQGSPAAPTHVTDREL